MCTSPHEMTSAHIEEAIEYYRGLEVDTSQKYWGLKADQLAAELKWRAENGTYDTAGHSVRNETQRTESNAW